MKYQRPVNLNLFTIRFPLPAIVSILHRISGVILSLAIPFLIWALGVSLSSQQDFDDLRMMLINPWMKFLLWAMLAAFCYHLVPGIRHLLMDMGIGEGLKSGVFGAQLTLVVSVVLILLAGIWLW